MTAHCILTEPSRPEGKGREGNRKNLAHALVSTGTHDPLTANAWALRAKIGGR